MKNSNLRAELARYGIKNKEIAKALDISESGLAGKLSGRRSFYLDEAFTIVDMINNRGGNLDVTDLFREPESVAI